MVINFFFFKYYNYLHRGLDRAYCKIKKINNNSTDIEISDEISTFIDGRYIEAAWRKQEFPICFRSHSAVRLAVHPENLQQLIFNEKNPSTALDNRKTTLTA